MSHLNDKGPYSSTDEAETPKLWIQVQFLVGAINNK